MLQIVDEIFSRPEDKVNVLLLFANTSPKDVLLREKIDGYTKAHGDQFRVVYICDKNPENVDWIHEEGYITRALLDKYLPKPDLKDKVSVHSSQNERRANDVVILVDVNQIRTVESRPLHQRMDFGSF
jgi:NAD(P)H-flavin reductase